jgi:hypothetical protein
MSHSSTPFTSTEQKDEAVTVKKRSRSSSDAQPDIRKANKQNASSNDVNRKGKGKMTGWKCGGCDILQLPSAEKHNVMTDEGTFGCGGSFSDFCEICNDAEEDRRPQYDLDGNIFSSIISGECGRCRAPLGCKEHRKEVIWQRVSYRFRELNQASSTKEWQAARDMFLKEHTEITKKSTNKAKADTYLNCPYEDKNECKAAGGRWDNDRRKWFAPVGSDLNRFTDWLDDYSNPYMTEFNEEQDFASNFQIEAGIAYFEEHPEELESGSDENSDFE